MSDIEETPIDEIVDTNVEPISDTEDIKPVVVSENAIEAPKKRPRTAKQIEAFKKMTEARIKKQDLMRKAKENAKTRVAEEQAKEWEDGAVARRKHVLQKKREYNKTYRQNQRERLLKLQEMEKTKNDPIPENDEEPEIEPDDEVADDEQSEEAEQSEESESEETEEEEESESEESEEEYIPPPPPKKKKNKIEAPKRKIVKKKKRVVEYESSDEVETDEPQPEYDFRTIMMMRGF